MVQTTNLWNGDDLPSGGRGEHQDSLFSTTDVFRDRRLTDLKAELEPLTVDAGCTPERVGKRHLSDEVPCFPVQRFSPGP